MEVVILSTLFQFKHIPILNPTPLLLTPHLLTRLLLTLLQSSTMLLQFSIMLPPSNSMLLHRTEALPMADLDTRKLFNPNSDDMKELYSSSRPCLLT